MRDKRLRLLANEARIQAWYQAARSDGRSFSSWAVWRLSGEKVPVLSKKSQRGECDGSCVLYLSEEDRQLWEQRAAEAGLELSEWIRRALDKSA